MAEIDFSKHCPIQTCGSQHLELLTTSDGDCESTICTECYFTACHAHFRSLQELRAREDFYQRLLARELPDMLELGEVETYDIHAPQTKAYRAACLKALEKEKEDA